VLCCARDGRRQEVERVAGGHLEQRGHPVRDDLRIATIRRPQHGQPLEEDPVGRVVLPQVDLYREQGPP